MVRRLLGGTPRRSAWLSETLLPKWLALPVFASDPICSVAYTTEQIVLVLTAGGLAALMLTPWAGLAVVVLSVGFVVVLVLANLRGTKESGQAFAVPTYMFIGLTFLMFFYCGGPGPYRWLAAAETATSPVTQTTRVGGVFTAFLLLRAFASGCTALTGWRQSAMGRLGFASRKAVTRRPP